MLTRYLIDDSGSGCARRNALLNNQSINKYIFIQILNIMLVYNKSDLLKKNIKNIFCLHVQSFCQGNIYSIICTLIDICNLFFAFLFSIGYGKKFCFTQIIQLNLL